MVFDHFYTHYFWTFLLTLFGANDLEVKLFYRLINSKCKDKFYVEFQYKFNHYMLLLTEGIFYHPPPGSPKRSQGYIFLKLLKYIKNVTFIENFKFKPLLFL